MRASESIISLRLGCISLHTTYLLIASLDQVFVRHSVDTCAKAARSPPAKKENMRSRGPGKFDDILQYALKPSCYPQVRISQGEELESVT